MKLSHTYYAPDTGANPAGGAPETQTPAAATPATTTDNGTGGDGKTFSQAEIDALIGDRAKRAKEAGAKAVMDALGIQDIEAAKALIAEATTLRQSQMSELEKAQQASAALQKQLDDEKAAKEAAIARADETLLRSAVLAEAAGAGFHNPADAWLYVDRSKLELSEDGEVKGAKAVVEAVAKERGYLVKTGQAAPTPGSPRTDRRAAPATATPDKKPVRIGF